MKTTAFNKELYVFVDDENRWLSNLFVAMHKGRLPVSCVTLFNGELKIEFELKTQNGRTPVFELTVRRRDAKVPAWQSTERFSIAFFGSDVIDAEKEQILMVSARILTRFDPFISIELKGPAFVGSAVGNAELDILRMFPFVTIEQSEARGIRATEILIRTTPLCNQRCPFCSGPLHEGPSSQMLRDCLCLISAKMPGADVTITGGEPGTRSEFEEELSFALSQNNIGSVQVQTNAVAFASRIDPALFAQSEKLAFFVSFHSAEESVYDCCVGTSGHFLSAVEGIRRILAAGHRVILNTVICRDNLSTLSGFVPALVALFGDPFRWKLHFSSLICQEWNLEAAAYLVKYSDVVPSLRRLTQQMTAFGISTEDHFSSTHAAIPQCFFSSEEQKQLRRSLNVDDRNTGYEDSGKLWVKAKRCQACAQTLYCLGVPRPYARRFGLDELAPLSHVEKTVL